MLLDDEKFFFLLKGLKHYWNDHLLDNRKE